MTAAVALALAVALLLVTLLVSWRVLRAYFRLRGTRVVACPETEQPAAVEVDIRSAALTASVGKPVFHLTSCSRWPERHECGQECLRQVDAAPLDCLVRTRVTSWYEGKACALCGAPVGAINWLEHRQALMSPERVTVQWHEIEAVRLSDVLGTYKPVCWSCHVAESFRRQHPELVLDNPWTSSASAAGSSAESRGDPTDQPAARRNPRPTIPD
jgi:hypothetical protein